MLVYVYIMVSVEQSLKRAFTLRYVTIESLFTLPVSPCPVSKVHKQRRGGHLTSSPSHQPRPNRLWTRSQRLKSKYNPARRPISGRVGGGACLYLGHKRRVHRGIIIISYTIYRFYCII